MKVNKRVMTVCMTTLLVVMSHADTAWIGTGTADAVTNTANWSAGLPTLANPATMGDADFVWSTVDGDMNDINLTITGLANWDSNVAKNDNVIDGSTITLTGASASMTSPRGMIVSHGSFSLLNGAGLDFNRDFRVNSTATGLMDSANIFRARSLNLNGGTFTLADGTIHLDNTSASRGLIVSGAGYLDITSETALLKRAGDFVTVLQGQIDSGFIRQNGAVVTASAFSVTFDGTNTLVAIPEPATFGMIAMFGGGILFIRRRFMI